MTQARQFSSITNPYGLLRSPWNTNPVPYVMRSNATLSLFADGYKRFPSCSSFAEAFDVSAWGRAVVVTEPLGPTAACGSRCLCC